MLVNAAIALLVGAGSLFVNVPTTIFKFLVLMALGIILVELVAAKVARSSVDDSPGRVTATHDTARAVHSAAGTVLTRVRSEVVGDDRVVCLATLPGHSGPKRTVEKVPTELAALWEQIEELAGAGWRIRHLMNFCSHDELRSWLDAEPMRANAQRWEVKAYATSTSVPVLAPLIVGNRHVLFAYEDTQIRHLRSAVHLEGGGVTAWATEYFDDLWDAAPYNLRTQRHVLQKEVMRLSADLGNAQ